jgi:hypothetical protein
MRRWLLLALLAGLALPGCTWLNTNSDTKAPKLKVADFPAVRPEQVTTANAMQKARDLNEELDREAENGGGR